MFPLKPPFYFINVYVHRAHQVPTFSMFCAASAPAFRCFRTSAWLWQSAGTEKRSHQRPNMTATPFPSRCFSRSWNCLSCRLTNWKHLESVLQSFKGASNSPRAERCFLGAQVWAFVGAKVLASKCQPSHKPCAAMRVSHASRLWCKSDDVGFQATLVQLGPMLLSIGGSKWSRSCLLWQWDAPFLLLWIVWVVAIAAPEPSRQLTTL